MSLNFDIPFAGRAHGYLEVETEAVIEVMRNAKSLTQGEYLKRFQEKAGHYLGVDHVFAVSNATNALEIAAQLCCFDQGDEVILPAHTFTSSAYPFIKAGARVVWADIDLKTRVVNVETIASCLTSKTRAIVIPHLYGYGVDMPPILELAERRGILVIEDAAQAFGVEVSGKKVGTFGHFAAFSFHAHKNISTLGEGGILVVREKHHAELVSKLRHNGHCDFEFHREDYWIPAMGNVDLPELDGRSLYPSNYCLNEVACVVGELLIDRVDHINSQKRQRALQIIDSLTEYPELEFHRVDSTRHNYHLLVAWMKHGRRDQFIRKMATEYRIQCVVQYFPLYRYPFYQKLGLGDASCPNTDRFFDSMVSFPFQQSLCSEDLDKILLASKQALRELAHE